MPLIPRRFSFLCALFAAPAFGQLFQAGSPFTGAGDTPQGGLLGTTVAISADGSTAAISDPTDNGQTGAVWIFTHSSAGWAQQGGALSPSGAVPSEGYLDFGSSVALSSDGNTLLVGAVGNTPVIQGPGGQLFYQYFAGGAFVFTRSNGVWTQQGGVLLGSTSEPNQEQGLSVSLSADGDTALIGSGGYGAWVFTNSNGVWTQQSFLLGAGAVGNAEQGTAVALSAYGDTALIGGPLDNSNLGAAWVFTNSSGAWTQQGNKLIGAGAIGEAFQGTSVALSSDGATALIGGPGDNEIGAAWVFTASGGVWTQQGNKLVGSGAVGSNSPGEGNSVQLAGLDNTALIGGVGASQSNSGVWLFNNVNGEWMQMGPPLVLTGCPAGVIQVALSYDGNEAVLGLPGATFCAFATPVLSVSAPGTAHADRGFNITVAATDSLGAPVTGYTGPVQFTSTARKATLPPDSTLTNGSAQFRVILATPGTQTVTATDTTDAGITATSTIQVKTEPPAFSKAFGAASIALNGSTTLSFTVKNPNQGYELTDIAFTDVLPPGLEVSSPSGVTGSCGGGTIAAEPNGAKVRLSGADLKAGGSCTFGVNVTATTTGAKTNITGAITSGESGKGGVASATIDVN